LASLRDLDALVEPTAPGDPDLPLRSRFSQMFGAIMRVMKTT